MSLTGFDALPRPHNDAEERNRFIHRARISTHIHSDLLINVCVDGLAAQMEGTGYLPCYCGTIHTVRAGEKCCESTCKDCYNALLWQGIENFQT